MAVGCGATSSGSDDPFDPTKNPGSQTFGGGGAGGTSSYFADQLKMNGSGSGSGSGGDEKICAQQNVPLNRLPPEIMVVLDRSGSMRRNAEGEKSPPDKWGQTTRALDSVLADTQAGVYWGLKMYPSWKQQGDSACAMQGLRIAPELNQHGGIMSEVNDNPPTLDRGATPTAKAVEEATAFLAARTSENPKFLLLATDGIPNCGNDNDRESDVPGAIAAVNAARQAGFGVFVVGIAASGIRVDGVDAFKVLNDLAEAGGRPREGGTKFYSANNEAELKAALGSIASQAADCTFTLTSTPSSPGDVAVELDDKRLGQGTDWEYGAGNRSVVVKGGWCDKLKKGDVKKALIKFGCPGMLIL